MARSIAIVVAGAGLWAATSFAQGALTGSYQGSYTFQAAKPFEIGVTLVIAKAEAGAIAGTGTLHTGACRGDYPVSGKGQAGGFFVVSGKGGPAGDCTFGFKGRLEGNKLVGTIGKYDVELRKQ